MKAPNDRLHFTLGDERRQIFDPGIGDQLVEDAMDDERGAGKAGQEILDLIAFNREKIAPTDADLKALRVSGGCPGGKEWPRKEPFRTSSGMLSPG